MELHTKLKGFKLLNDAGLTDVDMKIVLKEVNFNKDEKVYKAAKMGIGQKHQQQRNSTHGHQGGAGNDGPYGGGSDS